MDIRLARVVRGMLLGILYVSTPLALKAQLPPESDPRLPCGMQPFTPQLACSPVEGTGGIFEEAAEGDSAVYGPNDPPPWTPGYFDPVSRTETILPIPPGYVDWDPGHEEYVPGHPGCAPEACPSQGIEAVIGVDERERITGTTTYPWRAIGLILVTFDNGITSRAPVRSSGRSMC